MSFKEPSFGVWESTCGPLTQRRLRKYVLELNVRTYTSAYVLNTHTFSRTWISKERSVCASGWKRNWVIRGLRNRGVHICTHVIAVRACVYMEPRQGEAAPKLHIAMPTSCVGRRLGRRWWWRGQWWWWWWWLVNANDGGGGRDHYRTAFATHSAVSVLPVNGTRVVLSLTVESLK